MDMDESTKKSEVATREEGILELWKSAGIFEKSLKQTVGGKEFVFYDGPPFATGLPHYGHILASVIKDVIPRYQTMRGRHVRRVWGWDCHGLPIENLIEQELGLGHKKDIETYGIGKFNAAARAAVLRYDAEWKKMIPRIGRFIDMEHSYRTMDPGYTESVWWAFKTLHHKGFAYQGFKSMHICPRCETTLSSNEIALGYKDITDISVTVKFELVDPNRTNGSNEPTSNGASAPKTFVLAWTTTPWTLPGNVALAVSPNEEYIKVKVGEENYILAGARAEAVLAGNEYVATEKMKGSDLVGKAYKPLFGYYASKENLDNRERGWKIYGADFVTMDSGTGVVHIAPAFGEDDMNLGKAEQLPFVQHVGMDGTMKSEVKDFAGLAVKPKGDHQATDIEVIKFLAGKGTLFSKEKIVHSYPHCWRCDTPLLNYAAESWFIKVPALQHKLLAENAKTTWVPANMRDGRFGKWLEGARDWAISRARYWGAPLPIWKNADGSEIKVVGSVKELVELSSNKPRNTYYVMRHSEAESNVKEIFDSIGDPANHLTEKGKKETRDIAETLKTLHIDRIISSPMLRAKETADIVAATLQVKDVVHDDRIKEINVGVLNGRPLEEFYNQGEELEYLRFSHRSEGGETHEEVQNRVMACLYEQEKEFSGKSILIVTHGAPARMMIAGAALATEEEVLVDQASGQPNMVLKNGEARKLNLLLAPRDETGALNLHRPYIDEVTMQDSKGEPMKRILDVFDCWYESGSMPYAQFHYPFENKELFEKNFPANFIGEGVDQTRGWFYSLLVLSAGLFDVAPFENVLVNGLILAEDGQKMSKKLKNYPDPADVINKYGADSLRYYLLSSPVVHSEDLAFSERGVDEVVKKFVMRLANVLSFYELYSTSDSVKDISSTNVLDQWILARLKEVSIEETNALDAYELDRAVKPLNLFIDDLSTWFVRRSRDRFKSDDAKERNEAIATTRAVLLEFSKLLAPIMPFLADYIYLHVQGEKESVHLESWPSTVTNDLTDKEKSLLAEMAETRHVVSLALEVRAKAGIKIRQPLALLTAKATVLSGKSGYIELIKDEVNVKGVSFDDTSTEDVVLDTNITPELKSEGQFRDLLRTVQELRKTTGLMPSDTIALKIQTSEGGKLLVNTFVEELKKTALVRDVSFENVSGEPTVIDDLSFTLALEK